MVSQVEQADCGLACLAMIAGHYGEDVDLRRLRHARSHDQGLTLQNLSDWASRIGFLSRPLRCDLDELDGLALPAILHWDFNHYVVLVHVGRRSCRIHDPALGIRTYPRAEVSERFTGVVLECTPRVDFRKSARFWRRSTRLALNDLFGGITGIRGALATLISLSLLLQLVALASPLFLQLVVDEVLQKRDLDLLTLLACGFLLLTFFNLLIRAFRSLLHLAVASRLGYLMGARLYDHLLKLPVSYFLSRHLGDIVSRFGSLTPFQEFITGSAITVGIDGLLAVTALIIMLLYSPQLTLLVTLSLGLTLMLRLGLFPLIRRRQQEQIEASARQSSSFMESVRTIYSIKATGLEPQRLTHWLDRFAQSINCEIRLGQVFIFADFASGLLNGATNITIICLAAHQVLNGEFTVGALYAFLAYRGHLETSVISLIEEYIAFLTLGLHRERLSDLMQETDSDRQSEASFMHPIRGHVKAEGLCFRWSEQHDYLFRDVQVEVPAGSSLAISGPSGCGKTTLLGLLSGREVPLEGKVLMDDRQTNHLSFESIRRQTAAVTQADTLLSGSIMDNICMFAEVCDTARMLAACDQAELTADINAMAMGFDTLIGDLGTTLSAGQKQRLLLARALYMQPRVLYLDEGTSHIDPSCEARIMHNLKQSGMTLIYVAHGKELLTMADQLLLFTPEGIRYRQQQPGAVGATGMDLPVQPDAGSGDKAQFTA